MVRSALNATRILDDSINNTQEKKDIAKLLISLKNLLSPHIPSDQTLIGREEIMRLSEANREIIKKINDIENAFVFFKENSMFQDFFQVVRTLYSIDFIKKQGFFDHYELMQYLLNLTYQGQQLNYAYSNVPFNISKLTMNISKPKPEKPIYLAALGWFQKAALEEEKVDWKKVDSLSFLSKHPRTHFKKNELPQKVWKMYRFLRKKQVLGKRNSQYMEVSQQVYENRLFVLVHMDDNDFYQRYRSVKNNSLFYEYAKKKLPLWEFKKLMSVPYQLPGGNFTLPKYELLGYLF